MASFRSSQLHLPHATRHQRNDSIVMEYSVSGASLLLLLYLFINMESANRWTADTLEHRRCAREYDCEKSNLWALYAMNGVLS